MSNEGSSHSKVSRRTALGTGLAVTGTVLATSNALGASASAPPPIRLNGEQWRSLLGQSFQVSASTLSEPSSASELSSARSVVLSDVQATARQDETHRPAHVRGESISLLFQSSVEMTEHNYRFNVPGHGPVELMIAPTKNARCAPGAKVYEAVLN